jgi:hypothetical protein
VNTPSDPAKTQPEAAGTTKAPSPTPTAAERYQIFEQVALEKLRLGSDQGKPVVFLPLPVRASAIAAIVITGLGVLWALLAKIPVQVRGTATIIPEGPMSSAVAGADGVLYYQISGTGPQLLSPLQSKRNQQLSRFWAQSVVGTTSTLDDEQLEHLVFDAIAPAEGQPLVMPETQTKQLMFYRKQGQGAELSKLFVYGNTVVARINNPAAVEELDAVRRVFKAKLLLSQTIILDRQKRSISYRKIAPMIKQQLKDRRQEQSDRELLLERMQTLWSKGFVSSAQLLQEKSTLGSVRQQVVQLDRDGIDNNFSGTDQRLKAREEEVNKHQTKDQLQNTLTKYMSNVFIIAPPSGIYLVALYQQNGMEVRQGDELYTYTLTRPVLPSTIPVFVDATTIQQLQDGMRVLVTPKGISRAQYGGIPGVVNEVGRLPLKGEGLAAVAGGRSLAAAISQANPTPYLVRVKLRLANPSQCKQLLSRRCYAWSSRRIPPFPVRMGSQADVQITTIHRRPIEFVMPALRQALGLAVENR